jgi:hypothetical protein
MRGLLIVPIATIAPIAMFQLLQMVTGDPLASVVLGLVLLIAVGSWFSRPGSEGQLARRRIG